MIKQLTFLTIVCMPSMIAYGQTKDSITHTQLVADYDYTCHTSDADGKNKDVSYGITLQVAQNMACTTEKTTKVSSYSMCRLHGKTIRREK